MSRLVSGGAESTDTAAAAGGTTINTASTASAAATTSDAAWGSYQSHILRRDTVRGVPHEAGVVPALAQVEHSSKVDEPLARVPDQARQNAMADACKHTVV